jgi:hypothetical protein
MLPRIAKTGLQMTWALCCLSASWTSSASASPDFGRDFYSTASLTTAQDQRQPTGQLDEAQKRALSDVRVTLIAFLRSVNTPNTDLRSFLSASLGAQFPIRDSLVVRFLEPETTLLRVRIIGFSLSNDLGTIGLDYMLTREQEGVLCEYPCRAEFARSMGEWKIAGLVSGP